MYINFSIDAQEFDPDEWDMDTEVTWSWAPGGTHVIVTEEVTAIKFASPGEGLRLRYKHQEGVNDLWANLSDIGHHFTITAERPAGRPLHEA